jgi:hypothetical protein
VGRPGRIGGSGAGSHKSECRTTRSGAVKKSKNAGFSGCKSLKTNDRIFAKTYFLTAPHARGYPGAGASRLVRSLILDSVTNGKFCAAHSAIT